MKFTRLSYDNRFKEQLDAFLPKLSNDLNCADTLQEEAADRLIAVVLERACQCQNDRNITLGRQAAVELPRQWLLERIERVAEQTLDLANDEWEFRRFLEVSEMLDRGLLTRLISNGLASPNPEIVEAAHEYQSGSST